MQRLISANNRPFPHHRPHPFSRRAGGRKRQPGAVGLEELFFGTDPPATRNDAMRCDSPAHHVRCEARGSRWGPRSTSADWRCRRRRAAVVPAACGCDDASATLAPQRACSAPTTARKRRRLCASTCGTIGANHPGARARIRAVSWVYQVSMHVQSIVRYDLKGLRESRLDAKALATPLPPRLPTETDALKTETAGQRERTTAE